MFGDILSAELLKVRKSKIWLLILVGPIIGVFFAYQNFFNNYPAFMNDPRDNEWLEAWTQVLIFYAPLILPVMAGVYAAFVCRFEHISGGWKQLLALPIKRSSLFLAKLCVIFLLLALTQIVVLLFFLLGGWITGLQHSLPFSQLLTFTFQGWLAVIPLATIQMFFSTWWSNFGSSLAIGIGLSLPALLIGNSSYGQFYPWAQPLLAMSPIDESPLQSLPLFYMLFAITFILALLIGLRRFSKMEIH
jgi:hypothetical protein